LVGFNKCLAGKKVEKATDPVKLYETLDRAHDKGPLRPAQLAVLKSWFADHQPHRATQGAARDRRVSPLPEAQPGLGDPQRQDLSTPSRYAGAWRLDGAGKKKAAAVHEEVAREVNRFA